jgi:hypothetical protein
MVLRIRLQRGRPIQKRPGKNRHVASALSALLAPVVLMAYVLGFWRLASDMGLAGEFPFSGLFSHWQVWIPLAALLHIGTTTLRKYGQGGDLSVPRLLTLPSFPPRVRKAADVKISSRRSG